jgi:tRNA A37 threonylcarbamoyladenosine dehydratase
MMKHWDAIKVEVMSEQIRTINPECEVIGIPEKYHEFLSVTSH